MIYASIEGYCVIERIQDTDHLSLRINRWYLNW